MKKDDYVLYYHSVTDKQVVGLARVAKEAYADPTAEEGDWSCVDLVPVKPLDSPVDLEIIKSDKTLAQMHLVTHSRLSVQPVTKSQFQRILKLGKTSEP
jgi:predicted RNA-binding protein with PUA-like domain